MYRLSALALFALPLAACDGEDPAAVSATATIASPPDTTTGVSGTVRFTQDGESVRMTVDLAGLSPGEHGFHVHAVGSCARGDEDGDGFAEVAGAALGHYDPDSTMDHGAPADDEEDKHAADFGNVTAGADGRASTTITTDDVTLTGTRTVVGRAVMVHERRDDLETDPGGNSGDRIGCGIVTRDDAETE